MRNRKQCVYSSAMLLVIVMVAFIGCKSSNVALKQPVPTPQIDRPDIDQSDLLHESWDTISNNWAPVAFNKTESAAEKGDVTAQYYLAIIYSTGNGVTNDDAEAFKWMQLAAQQGMARAERKVGLMYQNGMGTTTNLDEAVQWYQKAAAQGDAQAQVNLGWMYNNGVGVSQDYVEAAKFYREAAEQGHAMAQNNLGWLYCRGLGVQSDVGEALKWYQKSAEQGEPRGEINLAWLYATGAYGDHNTNGQGARAMVLSGGMAPNHELAEQWMRKAVNLNSAEGEYQFAKLLAGEVGDDGCQVSTNFPEAGLWFRKAAEQGYADAQYELAEMYNYGQLGEDQRSNCIAWYLKAAAQGNVKAKAQIGELQIYYPNNELLKSVNTLENLEQAAENGDLQAQYKLARRYQTGFGVPKDPVEAFKWMEKASQHSDISSYASDACYYLGEMYENGEGTQRNMQKAYDLYQAAVDGVPSGKSMLRVGQMYERGEGVTQNDQVAIAYYSNTFFQNDRPDVCPKGYIVSSGPAYESIESVCRLWSEGRGLPQERKGIPGYHDTGTSIGQWEGMVNTGLAEFYLGKIYYQGKLVPQDLVEAAARFEIATNQNVSEAVKALNEVDLKLSDSQKKELKERAYTLGKKFEEAQSIVKVNAYLPW